MGLDYRLPLSVGYVKVGKSEDVHLYARRHEVHFSFLCWGCPAWSVARWRPRLGRWMPRRCHAAAGIRARRWHCQFRSARWRYRISWYKAHVVKHGPDVEKLGIELQFLSHRRQRGENNRLDSSGGREGLKVSSQRDFAEDLKSKCLLWSFMATMTKSCHLLNRPVTSWAAHPPMRARSSLCE
jgi:hypothetical protein